MTKNTELLSFYKKIDNIHKTNNLRGRKRLYNNFLVLGKYYLIFIHEINGLFSLNSSFEEKKSSVEKAFVNIFNTPSLSNNDREYKEFKQIFKGFSSSQLLDPLGELYQKVLSLSRKQDKGIVFTPIEVIEYILNQLNYPKNVQKAELQKIMDLACGSGLFLANATKKICKKGLESKIEIREIIQFIESSIHGFDIDRITVFISKINIVKEILCVLKSNFLFEYKLDLNVYQTNSLEKQQINESSKIRELKKTKYDFIVGNPPYIESKRMDLKTKEICKRNFPKEAKRHFDIYACFLALGIELMKNKGELGFIIPNKFLISRFARSMREKFLKRNLIHQIVDLSHQKVFQPAVYPIILLLKGERTGKQLSMLSDVKLTELPNIKHSEYAEILSADFFMKTKNKTIYFPDRNEILILEKIFRNSKYTLGDLVRFRWSVSFHRKGLREKFVFKNPKGKHPMKFIGGKPFAGNREIERYNLSWWGYWIDYDREKARSLKNNFQDLEYFQYKKIFICQHALRIRATIDTEGYISKDIFLLGHLTDTAKELKLSLELILGILNSELNSYLYELMFSGTEIMGKYLHYLPTFLHDLPVILPSKQVMLHLEQKVTEILAEENEERKKRLDKEIDDIVYDIFNIKTDERELISAHIKEHLRK